MRKFLVPKLIIKRRLIKRDTKLIMTTFLIMRYVLVIMR